MAPDFEGLRDILSGDWQAGVAIAAVMLAGLALYRRHRLHIRAHREVRNYRALIDNLSEGIYRSTLEGRQLSANAALVRLNGYDSEAELLAGVKDIAAEWYVDPMRRDQFRRILMRDGKVENFISEIYRHKTRERIWISESARLVRHHKTGRPLFYEGSVREITETAKRLQLEEMFQKLTRQLPGGLFQLVRKKGGEISMPYVSSGFRTIVRMTGDADLPPPPDFLPLIHPEDRDHFRDSLRASGTQMIEWDCEFRTASSLTTCGRERWLRVTAKPEALGDGIIWHGYLNDISIRKHHEVEIEKLAFFDPLTELPNRRMLVEGMRRALSRCVMADEHRALLFIDLDNFKTLNDTMGHGTGDRLLKLVAERLRSAVEANDLVARIGGDEFVILLDSGAASSAEAHRSALLAGGRVLASLRRPFHLGDLQYSNSASVGVVVFDGKESNVEEIMKGADMAMYKAKGAGRNGLALFEPASLKEESDRFRLVTDLRDAIQNGGLQLHFQPQLNAFGNVRAAEALLRWNHSQRGMIPPDLFVPLSEQFGMAEDLARFVVTEAAATLKRWQGDPATACLNLAVNVSVQVITSTRFSEMLSGLLQTYRVDPGKLTLEVTEHVMARDQIVMEKAMHDFKRIGVRLSLDDFGTGYSSLAYLKSLPFDELKIDGSFVSEIENAQNGRALVKTIIAMARMLGMTVVAEQVETERQESFLRALGCDHYQGWLYSKALPLKELETFVRARARSAAMERRGTDLRRRASN